MRGIQTRPENTLLTDKAAEYLEAGPADVVDLIGYICNLPAAPRIVAEHMADAMFAGRTEFLRDASGKWQLATTSASTSAQFEVSTTVPAVQYPKTGRRAAPTDPGRVRKNAGRREPPRPLKSLSWVVVDVETTGGQPPSHRMTEFAAVIIRDGVIQHDETYETLINPERPIPPFVSRLTNINWGMVKNAPTFSRIADQVMRKLEGNVFVAHNAKFDWSWVCHEVARATGNRLEGPQLCTVRLARKLLPHLSRRSLDGVADWYGVPNYARHRAGGDAMATAECLVRMLRDAENRGCSTLEDLEALMGMRTRRKKKRRPSALPSPVTKDTTA
jgi:DNA polymerase III epsilon subunit family exonuclease